MKRIILTSIVLIASGSALLEAKTRKIMFRTLCVERVDDVQKVKISSDDGKSMGREINLFTDVSPVTEGRFKSDDVVFYGEKTDPDGKRERVPVGKATLGKSKHQLFVFLPGGDGEGELSYRVMAFDDDVKSFAMGTIRAINHASVPVRLVLADEELPEIPPGETSDFPQSKDVNEYNMYPVLIQHQNAEGSWVKGKSSNWKATDRRREIVVLQLNPENRNFTVNTYTDIPPWLEE